MAGKVEIDAKQEGDILVVRMEGRMDAVAAPEAEVKVTGMVEDSGVKLLFDWEGIEYLSSAGIRMLLSVSKKVREKKGKMVLCNVTDNVMDVFKMSGFDHVLTIVPDRAAGMAALGKAKS